MEKESPDNKPQINPSIIRWLVWSNGDMIYTPMTQMNDSKIFFGEYFILKINGSNRLVKIGKVEKVNTAVVISVS